MENEIIATSNKYNIKDYTKNELILMKIIIEQNYWIPFTKLEILIELEKKIKL